jgi:hypothetical protein
MAEVVRGIEDGEGDGGIVYCTAISCMENVDGVCDEMGW